MKRIRLLALTTSLGAMLALPASSSATVTIGSSLSGGPNLGSGCLGSLCTRVQVSLPADRTAPGGTTSPVNGTVIRWRVRTDAGDPQQPIALRVVSPAASGQFTGGAISSTVTPPQITGISTFPASLPIKVGDYLGLNYNNATNWYFRLGGGSDSGWLFNPALAQGSTRSPQQDTTEELLVNADVEPTAALSNVKKKAKKAGKVRLTLDAPNPGTLVAGDKKDKGVVAVTAAKKPTLVKSQRLQVSAAEPVSVLLKPTKAAKSALAAGRKPKAKLKLVFTPNGGSAFTQLLQVKLKR
jgi:hypothetical protein